MRLTITAAAAVCALVTGCAQMSSRADSTATPPIFDHDYHMVDLDNGLRVVALRTDYPDLVSMQIPVTTGSRNEVEPGKSGFAHFFEHMMFRGTSTRSADEQAATYKRIGADNNAYTSDDITNYHTLFTRDALETVIEVEADRFRNLQFTEDQFRTEAQAVKGEYLKNFSAPIQKLFEQLRATAFDVHPYEHTTMGFLEDIEDMPNQFEYGQTFFKRWYCPQNASIVIVGDIDPEQTIELVRKHWGAWACESPPEVEIPAEPPQDAPRALHVQWDSPTQPLVALAFRGPAFDSTQKDMPAMDLLAQIYFGETSELYQRLVVQERIADSLSTYLPNRKDPNLVLLFARVNDEARVADVARAMLDEVARARTEAVPAERLEATKSNLRYAFALSLNTSDDIAATIAQTMVFERTPETLNRQYARYAELTPADLLHYANTYLVDDSRTLATLSNSPELAGIDSLPTIAARIQARSAEAEASAQSRFIERPSDSSLVDLSFVFATGAADDPDGRKGLAALTAMMVADAGTRHRSYREVLDARYPLAAGLTMQLDKEMTRFAATVHADTLDDWYALAREQLLEPGWREEDFKRLQQKLVNHVRTDLRSSNDEELAKEAMYEAVYAGHPYGSYNYGHIDDIQSLTLADVQAFHARHYTQQALTVGLAGGYDPAFADHLKTDLAALPVGERRANLIPPAPPLKMRKALIIEKETPSVAVSFGFPIEAARGHPDWPALWLVRSWFGEHRSFNSHLFQRIREIRGMNYGDYAYIEYFPGGMYTTQPPYNMGRQQQMFQVWLRPLRSNNDAHFATRTALYELQKLIDEGMRAEDFEATRDFLMRFTAQRLQTQAAQLGYAIDGEYYGTGEFLEYVREGLSALSLEDVNAAIRRHLQTDDIQFVFVARDASDLKERIIKDTPSPLAYNAPVPEEIQAEDRLIVDSKLWFKRRNVTIVPEAEVFR